METSSATADSSISISVDDVGGGSSSSSSSSGGGSRLEDILLNILIAAIPVAIISKCLRYGSNTSTSSSVSRKAAPAALKDKKEGGRGVTGVVKSTLADSKSASSSGGGVGVADAEEEIFDGCSKSNCHINAMIARIKASHAFRNPIRPADTTLFSHQVAGHTTEVLRKLGSNILKPMNKPKLFWHEASIYEGMKSMGAHCSQSMKSFIPEYHGVVTIEIGNKIIPYLVLDDLTNNFKYPCCMDIKMGRQTFEPTAEEGKKTRELKKYSYQSEVGFRITGFKVYNVMKRSYMAADKMFGRSLNPHQIQGGLSLFFNNGIYVRRDVIIATISKLENILLWMKNQINLHLYCSSILVVYDGDVNIDSTMTVSSDSTGSGGNSNFFPGSVTDRVRVKLIDLAHAVPSNDPKISRLEGNGGSGQAMRCADEGYLFGLSNLISTLHAIVNDVDNQAVYDVDSSVLVPL